MLLALVLLAAGNGSQAEQLRFNELKDDETIVVDFFSTGCFHTISRQYLIKGGKVKVFIATNQAIDWRNGKSFIVAKKPMGETELTPGESAGLDALVAFYELNTGGGCTTRDTIRIEYYRDEKLLASKRYQDDSCATHRLDGWGRIDLDGRIHPAIAGELVAFWQIEKRMETPDADEPAEKPRAKAD